jgi:hypothetical protein
MKVRVEQIGEIYYPQYRRMCVWRNFQTQVSVVPGHMYDINVKFNTLEEAIKYAKQFDNVIHEVN